MYFLTIKFSHFSPNTICEQFKKQQRVKKNFTSHKILKNQHGRKFWGLKKRTCPGKRKAYGSPTLVHTMTQS